MRVQDIVERLTVLGLDAQQAAVYVHLSMAGPSKAGDVAQGLGLQRTETYRTLDLLVQRGYVKATDERPSRFEAAPPGVLFQAILATEARRVASTRMAEAEIAPALRSLAQNPGPDAAKNTFKLLQGRRDIFDALERMVRAARTDVLWLDTHPAAAGLAASSGLFDLLARRARDGLRVRAMMRAGPDTAAAVKAAGLGEAAREVPADRVMRLAVADGAEVLMWLASDEAATMGAERDAAVWSDARDFALTEQLFAEALWTGRATHRLPPSSGRGAAGPGGPGR